MSTTPLVFSEEGGLADTIHRLDLFAQTVFPILLLGESGVGKELLAARIHAQSPRRRSPFIPINCGALPAALFESELFGHERGSFSGADSTQRGILRSADSGTVFLDEIGDLDINLQVKLLRFLDGGEVRSVGSSRIDRIDVRIIAATNVNLYEAVEKKRFRWDLLQRLSTLSLEIPPLRDRPTDIVLLAESFLAQWKVAYHRPDLECLKGYRFPGNGRELKSLLAKAQVLGRGRVTERLLSALLSEEAAKTTPGVRLNQADDDLLNHPLEEIERKVIFAKLAKCQGNKKLTAEELGIAKSTLHEKIRKWAIPPSLDVMAGVGGIISNVICASA